MDILEDILGMRVEYTQWNKEKSLPFYLTSAYKFQKAQIDGCLCIIITPKAESPTLPTLKKQIQRIQKEELLPVVIQVNTMSAFRRKNMIESRIPFIIEEKQVYLPFMGTFLQAKMNTQIKAFERFMISSQLLFLLYIYNNDAKLYLSQAVRELPYSAMTITRAARQLESSGLFTIRNEGINKILFGKYEKKELYKQAETFLCSPVRRIGYLDKNSVTDAMVLAGTSALAEKTMLSRDTLLDYAITQSELNKMQLKDELLDPYRQVMVEIWKYNPKLFSKNMIADPISIALSLANDTDDRVMAAVAEMLDELWEAKNGNRI